MSDKIKKLEKIIVKLENQVANLKLDLKAEKIKTEQVRTKLVKESTKLEQKKLKFIKDTDNFKAEITDLKEQLENRKFTVINSSSDFDIEKYK